MNETPPDTSEMKPSELLRYALECLEKCEASEDYKIDMERWHEWDEQGKKCSVCLAGAVMSQTIPIKETILEPEIIQHSREYLALNYFVCRWPRRALLILGYGEERNRIDESISHPSYREDPEAFKKALYDLVDTLEKEGF